ncbi:MAG: hypothetical protein QOJ65_720 [Fimbriimonadaceae bacterium]|jgi:hypothetical protein|nr:hypothetical protein [Fimbriimonadaceae bacterium]
MKHLLYPARILRDTGEFWVKVRSDRDLGVTAGVLFLVSFVFLGLYGFIMGWRGGAMQALSAGVKLPVLFLLTLLICLPTLHLLHLLFGSKQSVMQQIVLMLATIAITATLLLGFAPVMAFFMMTTQNYPFIKLLNVLIIGICAAIGVKFFAQGMRSIAVEEDSAVGMRQNILKSWIVLYTFVGTQLAWTLRPFMGDPELPFQWARHVGGNFYVDIVRSAGKLFGMGD